MIYCFVKPFKALGILPCLGLEPTGIIILQCVGIFTKFMLTATLMM
jgi:hypothetical protein